MFLFTRIHAIPRVGFELENNALRRRRHRSNDARCVSIVMRNDRNPDAAAQDRDNSKDDKGPGRAFGGTVNSGRTEDQEESTLKTPTPAETKKVTDTYRRRSKWTSNIMAREAALVCLFVCE